jgi:hypothetical protein
VVIAALQEIQMQAAAHANDPNVPGGCFAATAWLTPHFADGFHDSKNWNTGPNIEGTWASGVCLETTSDTFPASTTCQFNITWAERSGGQIHQTNAGVISQGSGDVADIVGSKDGLGDFVVQENHATGAGCEQDVVNLINVGPATFQGAQPGQFAMGVISIIRSSTCTSAKWVCGTAVLTRV